MLRYKLYDGVKNSLEIYNGQAIIDFIMSFYFDDCDGNEVEFTFTDFVSGYFRVYNERLGLLIKDFAVDRSNNSLILNLSQVDTTFQDNGHYYYEIGYVRSGGYEQVLRFGTLKVV